MIKIAETNDTNEPVKPDEKNRRVIDILMILGLVGCLITLSAFNKAKEKIRNGANVEDVFNWGTPHCITSIVLILCVLIHIWQHRIFLKSIIAKNLYLNNKITTIICFFFLLSVASVLFYLFGFTRQSLHFHSMVVGLFLLIVIIHLVVNFKKFIQLFPDND